MKGKHFVSIKKKNSWFIVFINSEMISAKEPVAKFIDEGEAWDWACDHARFLNIGLKEELDG